MTIKVIATGTLTGSDHWTKNNTYIVSGTYTIATGASLKIDDDTKVLLLNGTTSGQMVFQSGSKLRAGNIVSYAVNSTTVDTAATTANNGGWVFNGTVDLNNSSKKSSSFEMNEFKGSYLGSSTLSAMLINDMRNEEFYAYKLRFVSCTTALQLQTSYITINRIKTLTCTNAFKFTQPSTLTVSKVFNIRATNFLSGTLSNSILIEKGAHFIVVTNTAGSAITFVSEDTLVNGKKYSSTQPVTNGICQLKNNLFIYP